jgi:hypothetical protein
MFEANRKRTKLGIYVLLKFAPGYDFENIFAEKFSEKIGVFDSKQC